MSNSSFPVVLLLVFAAGFIAVGGVLGCKAMQVASVARRAATWPTAPAKIEHAFIRERIGSKGRRYYQLDVAYGYRIAGSGYRGSVINPMYGNSGPRQNAEALQAVLAPGSTVQVSYDPVRPENSMIVPGFLKEGASGLMAAGIILLMGLYVAALAGVGYAARGELISKIIHL